MPHQHQPPGLGEAILRELGVFGQSVGRQLQANQQFNVESQQRNLIDQLSFEAGEQQRQALLGQGEERLGISRERLGIAESAEGRAQESFDISQQPEPMTITDIENMLGRQALEQGGEQGFFDFQGRRAAAKRKPTKVGPRPPQAVGQNIVEAVQAGAAKEDVRQVAARKEDRFEPLLDTFGNKIPVRDLEGEVVVDEGDTVFQRGPAPPPDPLFDTATAIRSQLFGGVGDFDPNDPAQVEAALAAAGQISPRLGEFISREGLGQQRPSEPSPALTFDSLEGGGLGLPSSSLLQQLSRPGQGLNPADFLPALEPSPEQIQTSPQPGNLAAAQSRILKTVGGAVTPEQDQQGRAIYDDWDELTPEEKLELLQLGFPSE